MKKRWSSLLLCAAMLVSLCPAALAEGGVPYLDENGAKQTRPSANLVTEDSSKRWNTDWYVVEGAVNIGHVNVSGDVHLILADECSLTVNGGINVREGNSLTIYGQTAGTGKLTATAKTGAGIGGGNGETIQESGGTIIITGGTVTASGISAGIGGGMNGTGSNITISGGTVTANGYGGAGIGGGYGGDGGTIIINGGTVTATGGNGAGIGGGERGAGGKITISGGTVEATSKNGGAGIGGGFGGNGGTIKITGGEVIATSESRGAGIGGGCSDADGSGDGGTITISGGTVKAKSTSSGAGIGGGFDGIGGTITISGNADVTATSEDTGAGIGGGQQGAGGKITISGGTVTANSKLGAGIGGGIADIGGEITINGGTVTASSHEGAGIGGGMDGKSGTFAAGGNAFIVASSISDTSFKNLQGVFFIGVTLGQVYGSEITLATDATIPEGKTLVIAEGQILTIGENVTLTNNGIIDNRGTINNLGTIDGLGKIEGNAVVVPVAHVAADRWERDSSGHWHPCAAEDCAANHRYDEAPHTPGAAATCTRPQTCTECGYTLAAASGHTPGPEATCTEPQVCTVCGQEVAPALGHSFGEQVPQKDATTTSTGMKAHYLCSRCGNYFDENKNPTTAEALTIPKRAGSGGGGGSYTPPTYPPTVERPGEGGGAVDVSPSRPERGDTVTVTPNPDEGYEVDELTVTDRDGNPVEVTQKPDGTYTFKQPGGKVKIEVSYKEVNTPWNNPFADVSENDWYYEAVRFVQENGLMNGYSDGRFGTEDTLSRAQLAQILFNREDRPAVSGGGFNDVDSSAWYTGAVRWAVSQGIVGGYGNGTFGPNDPITREQLAVMLWRYSGSPAATGKELYFNDTDEISGFALEALRWAVENGVMGGYGDGRLGPQGQATRAQAAQVLKSFIENQEENT